MKDLLLLIQHSEGVLLFGNGVGLKLGKNLLVMSQDCSMEVELETFCFLNSNLCLKTVHKKWEGEYPMR